jgi:hypothetical protein
MPKVDGSPTAGEVTAEQLRQTKAELHRLAQRLEQREQDLSEKLAAANLAEQLRAAREEKKQREREEGDGRLPAHRPSDYTEEAAASLLEWITDGKSLRAWCRQASVSPMTVYQWMARERGFADRYARAYDNRADTLADEILDIADEVAGSDSIAAVAAAKLRVEARKWVAAKLKPQKWGDRQLVETSGSVTFQLGIAPRTPSPVTIEGNVREISDLQPRLADYESDSLDSASSVAPSAGIFSNRAAQEQTPATPLAGPGTPP